MGDKEEDVRIKKGAVEERDKDKERDGSKRRTKIMWESYIKRARFMSRTKIVWKRESKKKTKLKSWEGRT